MGIPFQSSSINGSLMIHVKVKTKDFKFSIPIPYVVFNLVIPIASSTFLQKKINKWTEPSLDRKKAHSNFALPSIDKKILKSIVKELKKNKGLLLVDIKAQDGTEVKVRL